MIQKRKITKAKLLNIIHRILITITV